MLAAVAFGLAFLVALALGTFTRRAAVTALLLMGLFAGFLVALARGDRTLLVVGPVLGLLGGLVLESIRDTARALRPPPAPAARRAAARRAAARRAA